MEEILRKNEGTCCCGNKILNVKYPRDSKNCTKFENTYVEDSTPDSRLETYPECDSEDYKE